MDRDNRNEIGYIVERFIRLISSKMFGYLSYFLDGPGMSTVVPGPHEEYFSSDFGIWLGK